jgi:Lon protease-like protein
MHPLPRAYNRCGMNPIAPSPAASRLEAVPLFPLPNVVLFPRAILPLHIFEERYRAMIADALVGDRQVAMALLRPGWEKSYHGRAEIEPIVCVGTILSHEQLPDGNYNLLLQGHTRATVVAETMGGVVECPYRLATLEPLAEPAVFEIDLEPERQQMIQLFDSSAFGAIDAANTFRQLVNSDGLPTTMVADLIAFTFLEDVWLKQSLLAEPDGRKRVGRTIGAMQSLQRRLRLPRSISMN